MSIYFLKYLARLPFSFLYLLSDMLYYIVYYIVRYRKPVVLQNLKKAFPHKPDIEIELISKRFYKYFCDLILENIKMHAMDEADFNRHLAIKNPELLHHYFNQNRSVVVLAMHYANWEWSSFLPTHLKHKPLAAFKPLHNKEYNKYINNNRKRFGAEMIPTHQVLRRIIKAGENKELVSLWLAGDQTPPLYHKFWMTFLNQDTMFYHGPAAISHRFNLPVIFQKTVLKKRGEYEISFEVLTENPGELSASQIMKLYIKKMEDTIREQPEYYLWSHKRWKHKRPEDIPLQE